MTKIEIKSDPFDIEFRIRVSEAFRKARKNIKIVTGEIGAYSYLDIRSAVEEAAQNKVQIQIYATGPDQDVTNRLLSNGISVYRGTTDPLEHFMIVDDKQVIVSYKKEGRHKPTPIGERNAVITDEHKDVQKYLIMFTDLMKKTKPEKSKGQDPLLRMTENTK